MFMVASAGQLDPKPPRRAQGTSNDIDLVSAYLPYCDAMLIDNRTRAMLTTGMPKTHAVSHPCRLFSKNTGDAFVAYLKQIEEHADPLILALVRDTYGEEHLKRYVTM